MVIKNKTKRKHNRKIYKTRKAIYGKRGGVKLNPAAKEYVPFQLRANAVEFIPGVINKYRNSPENDYLALDCEMVKVEGGESVLAQIAIVNLNEEVIYKTYVKPSKPVIDYITHITGIKNTDLTNAPTFSRVKNRLKTILEGKVIIGHGLDNDIKVIGMYIPENLIWDSAKIESLMTPPNYRPYYRARKLKNLTRNYLGYNIQTGEHDPEEDALASMRLFKRINNM